MKLDELYPSRCLKSGDVVKPVLATIQNVSMESVVENEDEKPVMSFVGDLKPMVLNKTNGATVAGLYGPETDAWVGKQIVLFSTKVPFQGKLVDSIRIRAPKHTAPAPAPVAAPVEDDDVGF